MAGASIPKKDLASVCAAEDEGGVEGGEAGGEDVGSRVESIFRARVKMKIPDLEEASWVVGCGRILRVGG